MPERIQRKRTRGWKMPEGAVYVGRPTKWGNKYRAGDSAKNLGIGILFDTGLIEAVQADHDHKITVEEAVLLYRFYIIDRIQKNRHYYNIERLKGKDLACWCKPGDICHADVLLELANGN